MKTQLGQPRGEIEFGKPCPYRDKCELYHANKCPYVIGEIDWELVEWKADYYWDKGFVCVEAKKLDQNWRDEWVREQAEKLSTISVDNL